MATTVIMPRQGQSVETCIITKWFKQKGEKVAAGDILFSYETDKAAFDLEAPADGVLLDVLYGDGAEVPVLSNVAVIGQPGESVIEAAHVREEKTVMQEKAPEEKIAAPAETMKSAPAFAGDRIRISPRAKKWAEDKGIDFSRLRGSGPNGRIICKDVEKSLSEKPAQAASNVKAVAGEGYSDQPLSNVRKIIAKAMHASLQNSAQLTHHMSADVRKLLEARKKVKEKISSGTKQQDVTLNDMICWCVIRALEKYPEANSHFLDDKIRTFGKVHLGLAVDTSRGLMVPALKNASDMNLSALSRELKSIADSCRKGNVSPELLQSNAASFTVSNLGNYGVEMFTPVINLPQAAILGVCTIIHRPADLGNNTFGFVPYIGLSLTYDHRAIDGGPATSFLREIKEQIEKFEYRD
ncbi:MAG TPA: dihydrolipoamide acetyltransferase family protein [Bacteroidales bacterium]|nr:dihydrolipoamide acetyltransferase family protein [Bacteroidales bacterium]